MRLSRWRLITVALVLLGALFVDSYSLIYRYFIVHQPLGQTLTSNPSLFGHDLYIHKGLDLQGGTALTIVVCHGYNNPPGSSCREGLDAPTVPDQYRGNYGAARDATIPILQQRVNSLGVSEATVQAQGNDAIVVQLPGVGIQQAIQTVGTTAKLHFATAVAGAPPTQAQLANPSDPAVAAFLADQAGLYDATQFANPGLYPTGYHWKIDNTIQGTDVTSAGVGVDSTGGPAVDINFNTTGANEWSKITTAAAAAPTGTPPNLVAIFLDNQIISAPQVQSASAAQTQITGLTAAEANNLATQVNAGALPADIAIVQQTEVSATLGQDSVRNSLIAGALGLLVVILFMVGYYRFAGLLASVALLCYAGIVLAVFKLLPFLGVGYALSLPGLAGFVLSVGMAVDANVLIFERTRDELRHGRSVGTAIEAGFARARLAIRDSNLSTLIACLVLYLFGSGIVSGFAVTLAIGVCASYFSAVFITRNLMGIMLRWRLGRNPKMYTQIHEEYETKPPKGRFDIVKSRNKFFAGSILIIIPGILAIIFWGFRLGLDFAGGSLVNATVTQPVTQQQIQTAVDKVAGSLQPQVESQSQTSQGYPFAIRILPSPNAPNVINQIQNELDKDFHLARDPNKNPEISVQTVGPSVASGLVTNAILLVLVASVFIAVFLAFAFRKQRAISPIRFSVCTFFKLLHDVFVLAGIWAIIGHFSSIAQVDSLFITALLTSVAFSIHDTIVVFDRVRENLRTGPRFTFEQTINLSTAQTMTRSLNTALTVVFVLVTLVLFGGDSIRGFVLALLIGIITGTYSSIFNASTLLVAWEETRSSVKPIAKATRRVQRSSV